MPKSRQDYWCKKFEDNQARDERNIGQLLEGGWRVLIVWECALTGKISRSADQVAAEVNDWLYAADPRNEISGRTDGFT